MTSKKRSEVSADSLDNLNHVLKRLHDKERPRLSLKDYLEGRADMHIHYIFRVANREAREFCAILKPLKVKSYVPVKRNLSIFDSIGANVRAIGYRHRGQQEPVFVDDVEIVEEHEVVLTPSPCIIERLQLLDHCESGITDPVFDLSFSTVEGVCILQDREVSSGGVPFETVGVLSGDQCPEQMIKCSSGVVEAVTDNQGPGDDVWFGVHPEAENKLAGLRIGVSYDGVRITFSGKGGNSGLESIKVFLCPSDLRQKSGGQFSYRLSSSHEEP